jgi:hypothetical protein
VLALRGLSRVIKFCTRFLLREKWFADIWAEALHASQVAMVSAVDELEVAVAAVDVVFSMIKTVINMDNELTVAPATTASSSSSAGKKKTPQPSSSARPSSKPLSPAVSSAELQVLSKEDFEQLQSSKEDLWKRTWAAVRHAAAFPCPWYHGSSLNECYLFPDRYLCLCMCVLCMVYVCSPELALAIAQRVLDFYRSRVEHEFRYSDNIRVLLEIIVTIGQIRRGP